MAVAFFFLAVGFLCAYVRAKEALPETGKNGICTSRECTIVAADILRDMKPGVDPCTDFFDFNCGGFINRVAIPDDKAQIGYFNLVRKQNQETIRGILSPEINNVQRTKDDASKRNLIKLQSLYESCMDEKKMSEVGVKPLADLVQKMVKAFPVPSSVIDTNAPMKSFQSRIQNLNNVNTRPKTITTSSKVRNLDVQRIQLVQDAEEENEDQIQSSYRGSALDEVSEQQDIPSRVDTFLDNDEISKRDDAGATAHLARAEREELAQVIAQLAWLGVATMVEFDVDSDPKDPEMNVFKLSESGLGLPSKQYYDEEKIVAVYQKAVEEMFTIVLGKGSRKGEDKEQLGPIVWPEVAKNVVEFEKLLAAISSDPEDLDNSELTYNPRTLTQISELVPTIDWSLALEKLLGTGATTPNPIIVSMPEYLEKLNALLRDTPALTLQNYFAWRMIQRLSPNLAVEYRKPMLELRAALQGVSADLVTPRWETCVDVVDGALAFVKGLSKLEWLDNETLLNATEKVDLLVQKIGYSVESPNILSSESLEDYFKDLGIDKADFFGNQIRARTWDMQQMLSDLGKPVDKAKWLMNPQTVNAYYNPSANEIVFPAGILQQPFFHGDNPEYLNYGGIGVVAGHELTHAFDNEGRLYDARGKLNDWWSNSTLQEFKERSQCFIDQYGNFTVKDPQGRENHVNGKLTLGENLADNGGLKRSFDAWQTRFKSDPRGN
ncbi:hypothetical protein BGZ54_008857, partial [Gamsiella multidivaricata]